MEPTPQISPQERVSQPPVQQVQIVAPSKPKKARHAVFALFVGLPAIFFWLILGLMTIGILGAIGSTESCNIARISIHGILTTTDEGFTQLLGFGVLSSADDIVEQLAMYEENNSIKAIIIDVNSPGGTPVAADEIMRAVKINSKKTVAVVRDLGASAAYWAIAGADHIIASPVSNVGSIGVTMSYTESAGAHEEEGARWIGISSGPFKDAGNPARTLSDEEKAFFQTQVDTVHDYMVNRIANVRESLSREEVSEIADGHAFLGGAALSLKLIDELGGIDEAIAYIDNSVEFENGGPVLCKPASGGFGGLF